MRDVDRKDKKCGDSRPRLSSRAQLDRSNHEHKSIPWQTPRSARSSA